MPRRVLIAPDKFKGTLTASEAADAIAGGWRRARPDDIMRRFPISDGGDGFGELLGRALGFHQQPVESVDAAHRPCKGRWWTDRAKSQAILETAQIIGLAMLPRGAFHPFQLDTQGLGPVFRRIESSGVSGCLVGIGGSATNDGGFGMARALGYRFLNAGGGDLDTWTQLDSLHAIEPNPNSLEVTVQVAVDVQNPLLGPSGATRIYGPQKGVREEDMAQAERCLERLAVVIEEARGRNLATIPGAGAAGGLGFGLAAFVNASLESGFSLFAAASGLDDAIRDADLVLTGEGAIDRSTMMGKGVGALMHRCRDLGRSGFAFAGTLPDSSLRESAAGFTFDLRAISPDLTNPDDAMSEPAHWLAKLAEQAANDYNMRG